MAWISIGMDPSENVTSYAVPAAIYYSDGGETTGETAPARGPDAVSSTVAASAAASA